MKVTHRIPTTQYGYVEIEGECDSFEAARYDHDKLQASFKSGEGMPDKVWRAVVDACLAEKLALTPEQWESMSEQQQWFLKTIKNARNRK